MLLRRYGPLRSLCKPGYRCWSSCIHLLVPFLRGFLSLSTHSPNWYLTHLSQGLHRLVSMTDRQRTHSANLVFEHFLQALWQ